MITEVQFRVMCDYENDEHRHGAFRSTFAEWSEERPALVALGLLAPRPGSVISQITDAGREALRQYREITGKGRTK